MARILAYTTPARGHLYPLSAVLAELRDRGHDVFVRTLAAEVPLLRQRGFRAEPIDPAIEALEMSDWREKGSMAGLRRAVAVFAERAAYDAPDLRRAIEEVEPDALVVDVNAWGALATAEAAGKPWAMFAPYPLPIPSTDAPPFGPGLPPARGPLGRLRDRVLAPIVFGGIDKVSLAPTNAVRAAAGVQPVASASGVFATAPLVLAMTAEPLEYHRRDWPASVELVGPCSWEPPADPPPWLAEIDRPLVLVTTSSEFQDDGALVRVALEALADEPVVVVATVPSGSPDDYAVPANARVERFVPHGPLLERAACAVTHGGMGATQKALAHGVPVVAVPFGRDQFEVARRVEASGAGTRLPARRLTADRLRAKVRQRSAMAEGARRVQEGFVAAGGPARAADLVERRLLAPHSRPVAAD